MMRFDKNARIAWTLVAVVGGMLGMAYAAVPLYELFCKATGFGGTPIVVHLKLSGFYELVPPGEYGNLEGIKAPEPGKS